jgi:hypothetical protein
MNPTPPPVRPHLYEEVHAALVRAGRPVTRAELSAMFLSDTPKVADVQDALDALLIEGLAVRGKEGPVRGRRQTVAVWRAVVKKG